MKKLMILLFPVIILSGCANVPNQKNEELSKKILEDKRLDIVFEKAKKTLTPPDGQFKAGSNYPETWIRDFSTFVEIALIVNPRVVIKERILFIWRIPPFRDSTKRRSFTWEEPFMLFWPEYLKKRRTIIVSQTK